MDPESLDYAARSQALNTRILVEGYMSARDAQSWVRNVIKEMVRTTVYLAPGLALFATLSRYRDESTAAQKQVATGKSVGYRGLARPSVVARVRFAASDYYDP